MAPQQLQTIDWTQGDTLGQFSASISLANGRPADLSGKVVKFALDDEDGTNVIEATETGVTVQPTRAFSLDSTFKLTDYDHDVSGENQIVLSTTGTLPTGLSTSNRYYATAIDEFGFRVSHTKNGSPIALSDAGNGTHRYYKVGEVLYQPSAESVENLGWFYAWFIVTQDGKTAHLPKSGRKLRLHIVGAN